LPETFEAADYERALANAGLGDVAVVHRAVTGSTNDDAKAQAAEFPDRIAIFLADHQTRGRGRGANSWSSGDGGSIAMTIAAPRVDTSALAVLPLGVGASVARALRSLGAHAVVKWPNDVLIGDRKVCGILCESSFLGAVARVIAGIGINATASSVDPAMTRTATCLAEAGVDASRPVVVARVAAEVLPVLVGQRSSSDVVALWKEMAAPWWGEAVSLFEGDRERRVTLLDVNPLGQLVVRDETGCVRSFVSGEVRRMRRLAS
jgi:BirA family biotin operon repressor/biotin-[acetyl-CoA-carboxylase] ligase